MGVLTCTGHSSFCHKEKEKTLYGNYTQKLYMIFVQIETKIFVAPNCFW